VLEAQVISRADQATLDSIEALLVAQKASVRDALHGAHRVGEITGMIKMAKIDEHIVRDALLELCNAVGEHPDSMHKDGSLHSAFAKAVDAIKKAWPPPPTLRGEVTEHSFPPLP
jgi:hypothetical protein